MSIPPWKASSKKPGTYADPIKQQDSREAQRTAYDHAGRSYSNMTGKTLCIKKCIDEVNGKRPQNTPQDEVQQQFRFASHRCN